MRKQPKIVIVDYDVGNTYSVFSAITHLNYTKVQISSAQNAIEAADALILPGVGAFDECARNLKSRNLDKILQEEVITKKRPIFGICVGMQLLASTSEENGFHEGLGWIPGKVKRLEPSQNLAVPHVGWNNVKVMGDSCLFSQFKDKEPHFYFDHSFHYECEERFISAVCDYGCSVTASVHRDNIFGVQFHPEKSQNNGLRMFRSFFNWVGQC